MGAQTVSIKRTYSPGQSRNVALLSAMVETMEERGVFCTRSVGDRRRSSGILDGSERCYQATAGTLASQDILTQDRQYTIHRLRLIPLGAGWRPGDRDPWPANG